MVDKIEKQQVTTCKYETEWTEKTPHLKYLYETHVYVYI